MFLIDLECSIKYWNLLYGFSQLFQYLYPTTTWRRNNFFDIIQVSHAPCSLSTQAFPYVCFKEPSI